MATGLKNPLTHPPKRLGIIRGAVLLTALGLFAAAAALGMVAQPDPSELLPPSRLVRTELPLAAADYSVSPDTAAPFVSETRIRRGDTLGDVLERLGLDDDRLQAFLTQDSSARSIYKLYPGRAVVAGTDGAGNLRWLRYNHTPGTQVDDQVVSRYLQIEPDGDGYKAEEIEQQTDTQLRVGSGTIQSSLFAATDDAGIPDAITLQMADILGSKVDFLHGLRRGDQFRVVYEARTHQGRYAGPGRVLALEFTNQDKVYTAVWYDPASGKGAYYDFSGTSLRGAFLRTALKFTRISSTFGMRLHPLHKVWTGHKGVDYAAPAGTPIHSTADGVVEFAGVQNGYGNVVIIQHPGKYSTLYAHQSRIAPGVHKGMRVEQGEVIGYVGMTGWATGPHLHYEFRIDDQPVDPLSVDLPIAMKLEGADATAFARAVAGYKDQIDMLARYQEAAPADGDAVAQAGESPSQAN
jgi:murein DD-endopeptidase MepM/ murein hydrolase activator NlpD